MGLHETFERIDRSYDQKKLCDNIESRFRTTFIGCLDSIEHYLGRLWGFGSDEELTENQHKFKKVWLDLRTEILDKSNRQQRLALKELDKYFNKRGVK